VPTRVPHRRLAIRAARFGPEAECLPWEVGEKPTAREFHSLHLTDKTKPLTEAEDESGACSAKKGSESAISPSRFAVRGAPLVFQMLGTQRRLVQEVKLPAVGKDTYQRVRWGHVSFRNTSISKPYMTATSAHLWLGIYSSAFGAVKILWRIA
jgi:hypothetical protein